MREPKLTKQQIKNAADRAEGKHAASDHEKSPSESILMELIASPKAPSARLGRPEKWDDSFLAIAGAAAKFGATDEEIAQVLGVSVRALQYWKKDHPELLEVLKAGKEVADNRVERSLYNRAVGYSFESEKVFQYQGRIVRTKTLEHVPPDTTAQIFWLKNRRAQEWRDVHRHEVGGPGDFSNMGDEELLKEIKTRAKALGVDPPKQLDS